MKDPATVRCALRAGAYHDSLVLMRLQRALAELPGVLDAGVVMATPANRELLAASGLDPGPESPAITAGPYDLLIADLKMPGMDGLSVIREVKRYKTDLPVIVITGFSTESSAIEAINLGVSGYLTKPFRVPEVLKQAEKALGR